MFLPLVWQASGALRPGAAFRGLRRHSTDPYDGKRSKIKDSEETDITVKTSSSRSTGRQVFRSNGWNQHQFLSIFRKSRDFDFCFSIEIDPKSMNQKKLTSQSKPAHRDLQTGQKINPNGQNHPKFWSIFQKTCNLNFCFFRIFIFFQSHRPNIALPNYSPP